MLRTLFTTACILPFVFLLSFRVQASEVSSATVEALAQELQGRVDVLDRDYTYYHWTNADLAESSFQQNYILNRIQSSQQVEVQRTGDKLGKGFYLAPNPLVSSRFGAHLITLQIKRGTRLFQIYPDSRMLELSAMSQLLLQQTCGMPAEEFSLNRIRLISFRKFPACNSLWNQLMARLKIDGVVYSFGTDGTLSFCPNAQHRHAVMLYRPAVISAYRYSKNMPAPAVPITPEQYFRCYD